MALPGDEVVIFVATYGFYATAKITSVPKPRKDWIHRYGVRLASVRLIKPPISLGVIKEFIPKLTWANYPRSIYYTISNGREADQGVGRTTAQDAIARPDRGSGTKCEHR
jgi:hypothetical protein